MSIAFSGRTAKDDENALGAASQASAEANVASLRRSPPPVPRLAPGSVALPMRTAKPCRPPGYEIPFLRASFRSVPNVLPLSTAGMPSSIQTGAGASLR